ncbi:MAG: DinB family protein [Planctomycetota bacterium]
MATQADAEQTPAGIETPTPEPLETFTALEGQALIERYRMGLDLADPRAFQLSHEDADRTFQPDQGLGTWSCRSLMNHLADADLVNAMRIRRTLVEDGPVLDGWDHEAFNASPLYGTGPGSIKAPLGVLAASIYTNRQMIGAILYQLDPPQWSRRALHPRVGEMTLHTLIAFNAWHIEHHLTYLNAKVLAMLGPRPKDEPCDDMPAGGCGEGCGCAH